MTKPPDDEGARSGGAADREGAAPRRLASPKSLLREALAVVEARAGEAPGDTTAVDADPPRGSPRTPDTIADGASRAPDTIADSTSPAPDTTVESASRPDTTMVSAHTTMESASRPDTTVESASGADTTVESAPRPDTTVDSAPQRPAPLAATLEMPVVEEPVRSRRGGKRAATLPGAPAWSVEPTVDEPAPKPGFLSRHLTLLLGLALPALVLAFNIGRVARYTIDDSYISFRYAKNLARGLGLVYNAGEHVEGYTNFLWTCVLAAGYKIGIAPEVLAKILGIASAAACLVALYALERRFKPNARLPPVSTWLFAMSAVNTGYAVFGLETSFFVALVCWAFFLMWREDDRRRGFPWSGVLFALAGLTRPEGPLFAAVAMAFLGRRVFSGQNLLRSVVFGVPVAAHFAFKLAYYGSLLPNTFVAKTGDFTQQFEGGKNYLADYAFHASPIVWLALFALGYGIAEKRKDVLAAFALMAIMPLYILFLGADWMPYFRFLAVSEPFCFLCASLALRTAYESESQAVRVAALSFVALCAVWRVKTTFDAQSRILAEDRFWRSAAGGVGDYLRDHLEPGRVAVGDMGYIGYASDFPVLDLLGLTDPVIAHLPGGYTRKSFAPGYNDHVFEMDPRYFVLVGNSPDCSRVHDGQQPLRNDLRFKANYVLEKKIEHIYKGFWCIFAKKD